MFDLRQLVRQTILREQLINDGDLVIVAVSGGADSLSLLYILNEIRLEKTIPFSLYVAHLNHGLRGERARGDAEFVRREAKKAGLPFTIGEVDTPIFAKRQKLSVEDAARRLRYRFLEQVARNIGASGIALGHNRDDQAETLLLNLLRGAGLDGLSGMKFKRTTGAGNHALIRPLLAVGRDRIEEYCRQNDLSPRFDETNRDTRFLRNKIRLELLPFLEKEYNPNLRKSLAQLSYLLLQDRDYLQSSASQRLAQIIRNEEAASSLELDIKGLTGEHESLQGRILRLAICRLVGAIPREVGYRHINRILKLCKENTPHGTLHLPLGLRITKSYNFLQISFGRQRPSGAFQPFSLTVPGKKTISGIPGRDLSLQAETALPKELSWRADWRKEAYLDYDRVLELANKGGNSRDAGDVVLKLLVRTRRKGDIFYPLGAPGNKKLKKYFIDRKIPLEEREQVPLVIAGSDIIWVIGEQISHLCRITEKTKKALVLKIV